MENSDRMLKIDKNGISLPPDCLVTRSFDLIHLLDTVGIPQVFQIGPSISLYVLKNCIRSCYVFVA